MNLTKNKNILYSLVLGFLGFVVATYLTILHYKNALPPCQITSNCEKVLNSQFATVGPVPLALLGSLFYLTVFVLCVLILTNYKKILVDVLYGVCALGFVVSIALVFIQANVLHAFCQYCLLSEAISTGIMILCYLDFRERKKAD
jgi:uncharacterized membrane protein